MNTRLLGRTGLQLSLLSYGASPLGGVFGDINEGDGIRCVHRALELGLNFMDCSPFYGQTKAETVLGRALAGVPRESYILATKVGRYGQSDFDFSAERVRRSVAESRARLGVEHIDLIQCHDIEFGDLHQIVDETLPALRELQEQGIARFVGITGLPLHALRFVAARAPVDTVLSYCRYTLLDTSLTGLIPFLKERGIGLINAAPLAMGLLTQGGPPDWHPAPQAMREACGRAAQHCESKGASLEQLAIGFAVTNPDISTTVVGAARSQDIEQNARWAQEPLDEGLLGEVLDILAPVRGQTWPSGRSENRDR